MKKNYFCENLRYIRSSLNISQKEIANYLKLNPSSYSNYENGRREPGIDALIKISDFLNVEIDKLLTENLSNDTKFLRDIQNKLLNDIDYNEKVEYINSDLHKNLLLELEKKKKRYLSLLNNEIPKKIKEIDSLIKHINLYNNQDVEISDEISPNIIKFKSKETKNEYRSIDLIGKVSAGNPCYAYEEILDSFNIPSKLLCPSKEYFILKVKGDSMNKLYSPGELILIESTTLVNNDDIIIAIINEEATCKKVHFYPNEIALIPQSSNPLHKVQTYNPIDVHISGKVLGKLSDYIKKNE
ncbi:S24 family peptidase [Clostridium sp.]|uniref:helix-turn-helix domain-containing protein n=1 Tax=Clostridium sp. TaxID=1506 RepID=UPI0025B9EB33|nr:S24 family peptidase [Clostridium sp.]